MKILKFCILLLAVAAASGAMGCNEKSNTITLITVTPANQSVVKGTTQQFTANATLGNSTNLPWSQIVTWSSSNTAVATVSNTAGSNGLVTALDYGDADITAFDAANNIFGTATITVDDPDSITIFPANPSMAVNTTSQLSAIALFFNPTGTRKQVITMLATWPALSSSGVATITDTPGISGNGIVTAGAVPGTMVIQADFQAGDPISVVTGTTTLTVTSTPMASIAVSPTDLTISMSTTTQQQFTAIGTFQDGTTTPSLTTTWAWSSSNTGVATIDYYTGLAQAVAPGTATITAIDPITGVSGNTTFTVQ